MQEHVHLRKVEEWLSDDSIRHDNIMVYFVRKINGKRPPQGSPECGFLSSGKIYLRMNYGITHHVLCNLDDVSLIRGFSGMDF